MRVVIGKSLFIILTFALAGYQGINNSITNSENQIPFAPYIGTWKSDTKTEASQTFNYHYELTWFDNSKTIAEMVITKISADENTLMWKGFKRYSPVDKKSYYEGYSTFGISCLGQVYINGENLITEYDGFMQNGNQVKIKDVFSPIKEGKFNSVTYSFSDGKW